LPFIESGSSCQGNCHGEVGVLDPSYHMPPMAYALSDLSENFQNFQKTFRTFRKLLELSE
jgi:hypothetical protein